MLNVSQLQSGWCAFEPITNKCDILAKYMTSSRPQETWKNTISSLCLPCTHYEKLSVKELQSELNGFELEIQKCVVGGDGPFEMHFIPAHMVFCEYQKQYQSHYIF